MLLNKKSFHTKDIFNPRLFHSKCLPKVCTALIKILETVLISVDELVVASLALSNHGGVEFFRVGKYLFQENYPYPIRTVPELAIFPARTPKNRTLAEVFCSELLRCKLAHHRV